MQALGKGAHLPTLNDQDAYLYARDDVEGLLVGSFEPHAKGISTKDLPADFSFDLLDEDWDHFMPMMENALRRIPALETAEVRMLLNGPRELYARQPVHDGRKPRSAGPVSTGRDELDWHRVGGWRGQSNGGWIIAGEPTMELNEADIRRFAPE